SAVVGIEQGLSAPISGVDSLLHVAVKGRIRPIRHLPHKAMLHRIPVDVVHVPAQVFVVANAVFSEAALPQAAFPALEFRLAQRGDGELLAASLADAALDASPACAEVMIVRGQLPD